MLPVAITSNDEDMPGQHTQILGIIAMQWIVVISSARIVHGGMVRNQQEGNLIKPYSNKLCCIPGHPNLVVPTTK
jgi:hypothetical protein